MHWRDSIVIYVDLVGTKKRTRKPNASATAMMRIFHEIVRAYHPRKRRGPVQRQLATQTAPRWATAKPHFREHPLPVAESNLLNSR